MENNCTYDKYLGSTIDGNIPMLSAKKRKEKKLERMSMLTHDIK